MLPFPDEETGDPVRESLAQVSISRYQKILRPPVFFQSFQSFFLWRQRRWRKHQLGLLCFIFFFLCHIHLILRKETYCSKIRNISRIFVASLDGSHANPLCIFPVLEYVLSKLALACYFTKAKASSPYHDQAVPRDTEMHCL